MRVARQWSLDGEVIKNSEVYKLVDNTTLNNLVVSTTTLYPGKQTRGHSHKDQEEVYIFTSGYGNMLVGQETYQVEQNSIVLIPDGAFHKVWNNSKIEDLVFVCVFDGGRNH